MRFHDTISDAVTRMHKGFFPKGEPVMYVPGRRPPSRLENGVCVGPARPESTKKEHTRRSVAQARFRRVELVPVTGIKYEMVTEINTKLSRCRTNLRNNPAIDCQ